MLIVAASLCALGQGVFAIAGFSNLWSLMLVSRVIFGFGGEVIHAAQHTIISRWFKASELSVIYQFYYLGYFGNLH
jgi:MFS family permease